MHTRVTELLGKALEFQMLRRDELLFLLSFDENSLEASHIRLAGNEVRKKRFQNQAMLLCQTGAESFPCSADCVFCSFAKSNCREAYHYVSLQELVNVQKHIAGQNIYAHFLMFMHNSEFETICRYAETARKNLSDTIKLVVNCGDLTEEQFAYLKSLGVSGAYHVVRLGEGKDTLLSREQRIQTIKIIKKIGLDWYTCCEPVGAEHTAEEIIDQILISREYECFQNAVMRRISVADGVKDRSPISLLRSAQIVAVVSLAMVGNKNLSSIAIHEPDLLGLTAGANSIYCEFGSNPRDNNRETQNGRGYSVQECKQMLFDTGFDRFM